MGTRNLVAVILDGEPRIAQYGQWDGYLEGQGVGVVEFLKRLTPERTEKFKSALRDCYFITEAEWKKIWGEGDSKEWDEYGRWAQVYPELCRDTGSDILDLVCDKGKRGLRNNWKFGGDSLFCEMAYVIDLDNGVLEIYDGFQKKRPPDGERFSRYDPSDHSKQYYGCKLVGKWAFDQLDMEAFQKGDEKAVFNMVESDYWPSEEDEEPAR